MGLKAALSKPFAALVVWQMSNWKKNAVVAQHKVLKNLVHEARHTVFARDHYFKRIKS